MRSGINQLSHSTFPRSKQPRKKILVLSGVRGDTRRYRCFHTCEQLSLAGIDCLLSHVTDPGLIRKVEQAGIVIFHRVIYDRYVQRLIERIRRNQSLLLLDIDDLLFLPEMFHFIDSPDFADPIRSRLYQEDMRRYRETLDHVDGVLASTGFLAEQVREIGKPAWVHRNAFSCEMFACSEQALAQHSADPARIVIGYASGTPTHNRDFALIKPALQRCLEKHPQAELWLVGPLDPGEDWSSLSGRVVQMPLLPWRKLPSVLVQFDINLAPLAADNPFTLAKSEIKYVEAALVRVPTVASQSDVFAAAICSGENGYLAGEAGEWEQSLSRLIEDPLLRAEIGRRAYQDAMRRYHPQARSQELIDTLEKITEQFGSTSEPSGLSRFYGKNDHREALYLTSEVERHPTLAEMAIYNLRNRGFKTAVMRLWVFFRRLAAPLFPFRSRAVEPVAQADA